MELFSHRHAGFANGCAFTLPGWYQRNGRVEEWNRRRRLSRAERERRIIGTRDESRKKCSLPQDDSGLLSVTKAQHQVSAAERALLVGVGWKRTPRFPGMPAGAQGRESLLELAGVARSAGAAGAGPALQARDTAGPATLGGPAQPGLRIAGTTSHPPP